MTFHFDTDAADRAERFFGHLRHMKGACAGQPFVLQPAQRDFVRTLFGTKREDGTRRYRIAYLEIPRGGGKSTLAAGLALYATFCDGEQGAEVYSVASDRDQALLVFDPACWMVRHCPMLNQRAQIYEATKKILYRKTGSVYKAIAADAAGSHGFNAHCVVYDELHAARSRDLYDILLTSMGKREQPLMIVTTTAGHDRGSICWELHQHALRVQDDPEVDPAFLPVVYAADPEDDWTDEAIWEKANPNLDVSIKRDYLREQCRRAQDNPALENVFRNLHLNQWTEQAVRFLPMHLWDECTGDVDEDELEGSGCYAALDLASTRDLCALALLFPQGDRFKVLLRAWAPEQSRTTRDAQDKQSYQAWADRGLITLTASNVADYEHIRADLFELAGRFNIHRLIFDPWNATEFYQALIREGWPEDKLLEFRQSFSTYNEPTKRLLELVKGNRIEHGGNPLLRWMASNLAVKTDPSGNLRPDKSKSSDKIDGMTALLMALGVALTDPIVEYESMYSRPAEAPAMDLIGWFRGLWEKRSLLSSGSEWREFYGLDGRSIAGVSVTSRTMLGHAPLWRGINLLSSSVAKLPLVVYRKQGEDRTRDRNHPAYPLLRRRVNRQLRADAWLKMATYHAIFWGNHYSAILRDAAGRPGSLLPLAPWSTWPQQDPITGRLMYATTLPGGEPRKLPAEDVFHIRGLSDDGLIGHSVIELLAPSTGTSLAADEYAARWFAGGCQVQNVLKIPGHLKADAVDNMLKDWSKISEGLGRTGKTAPLYDGADLMQLGFDAEKSQLLQAREFGLITCANVLCIPPHKLGHPARTSYASLEQENQAFLSESLEPWLQEFESEAFLKLLSPSEQESESHFMEFNRASLLRPNLTERYAAYSTGLQNGFLTPNEVRRFENLPAVEGGDEIMRPLNQAAPATQPDASPQDDDDDDDQPRNGSNRLPQLNGNQG